MLINRRNREITLMDMMIVYSIMEMIDFHSTNRLSPAIEVAYHFDTQPQLQGRNLTDGHFRLFDKSEQTGSSGDQA